MKLIKTAFGPAGCKIIAHEKPSQRRTWAPHGQPGWSHGPDMSHYRCQNMYITASESERIVDTLEFFPHNSPMPQMSSTDRILTAAQDMTDALKHPHPDVPFVIFGDDTITALEKLSEIFTRKFKKQEKSVIPRNRRGYMVYNETSRQAPTYFIHQFKIILLKQIQLLPISRQTRNHLRGWSRRQQDVYRLRG
jgi:hypothetical protein